MTINNDYIALALHNDRAKDLQREAAQDRLIRQAVRNLRPRRRANRDERRARRDQQRNRDQRPAPSIPQQRSADSKTTAKAA